MKLSCSFLLLIFSFQLSLGQYQNNDSITDFEFKDVSSNSNFVLNESKEDFIVLLFISNSCPFVDHYINRIKNLDSVYTEVKFILVNAYSKDRISENQNEMKSFVKKHQLQLPYIKDENKKLVNLFGVEKLPEVYLLARSNGIFKLTYKGAIDDNPQSAKDVKTEYLKNAIDISINNKSQSNSGTHPIGCRVY